MAMPWHCFAFITRAYRQLLSLPAFPMASLAAGVSIGLLCLITYYPALPIAAVCLVVLLALLAYFWQRFFLCGVMLSVISFSLQVPMPSQQAYRDCHYEVDVGYISPVAPRSRSPYWLKARHIRCGQIVLADQTLRFWNNKPQLAAFSGQIISVTSELLPIHSRLNPWQRDFAKIYLTQGVRFAIKHLEITDARDQTNIIKRLRVKTSELIARHLPVENAAIILALITGDRSLLSREQRKAMSTTGTSHILAISGLHLALVGGMVWVFFQWLWALFPVLSQRIMPIQAGAVLALMVITFYALFTGFHLPVRRAWIMLSLLLLSWLWLKSIHYHAILLAATIVMLLDPLSVIAIGFYLSFIATFVVLWSAQLTYPALIKALVMQALINLVLLPIIWLTFGQISISAFFVNLIIIPWLGLWVLPLAIMACITGYFSNFGLTWFLLDKTTNALWQTIRFFESLSMHIELDKLPSTWLVVIVILSLLAAMLFKKPYLAIAYLALFMRLPQSSYPVIVLADSRYTSMLVSNGRQAIIIDPGRYYHHTNYARKWQRYLQHDGLLLKAIVLSDDSISKISATKWLLKHHPGAQVITLIPMELPYAHRYCQALALDHLELTVQRQGKHCSAKLNWFGYPFDLLVKNSQSDYSIKQKSYLIWRGVPYAAERLGAITLTMKQGRVHFDALRLHGKLWRVPIELKGIHVNSNSK